MADAPELYLIVPYLSLPTPQELTQALGAARVSCVCFTGDIWGEDVGDEMEPHIDVARRHAAALLENHADQAIYTQADGVHISDPAFEAKLVAETRQSMGEVSNVGVLADSRHRAMELAEAGADYVAFDIHGESEHNESGLSLIAWWQELFTIPVVAWGATSLDDVRAARDARADFVAIGVPPEDMTLAQWVAAAAETLRESEAV